jgi:hypothetical protein
LFLRSHHITPDEIIQALRLARQRELENHPDGSRPSSASFL